MERVINCVKSDMGGEEVFTGPCVLDAFGQLKH